MKTDCVYFYKHVTDWRKIYLRVGIETMKVFFPFFFPNKYWNEYLLEHKYSLYLCRSTIFLYFFFICEIFCCSIIIFVIFLKKYVSNYWIYIPDILIYWQFDLILPRLKHPAQFWILQKLPTCRQKNLI